MATLTGKSVASTYKDVLKINSASDNAGIDATLRAVEDGDATASALKIAAEKVEVIPASANSTTAFEVSQTDGTNILTVDSTNARVGIGTASPAAILDVTDADNTVFDATNAAGQRSLGSTAYVYNSSTTNNSFSQVAFFNRSASGATSRIVAVTPAANESELAFVTDDGTPAEAVRIDKSGNVGIGTETPDSVLHVVGTNAQTGGLTFESSAGTAADRLAIYPAGNYGMAIKKLHASTVLNFYNSAGGYEMVLDSGGNVGIGTATPGQLLDVNSGSGNAIADGWDTHSLTIYKENIEDASGYLDKVLACPSQKWNRKPFVSADEIKEAVLEEFGEDVLIEEAVEAVEVVGAQEEVAWDVELPTMDNTKDEIKSFMDEYSLSYNSGDTKQDLLDKIPALKQEAIEGVAAVEAKEAVYERQYSVWDEYFPEDNSHRQKALYNMPDGDLKNWIDEWCEAKRVEMRPEPRWQKKRLGLVADAELTAEHLPEVISINDEGEPTGIDTMAYIGILHNAIQELSAKVEALENQ